MDETSTFGLPSRTPKTWEGVSLRGPVGRFDANFAFRGAPGTKASFAFDLPEKGYSNTFLVYGVPVTAAVDLSGNVEIFVKGSATLNRQLEFEEVTVAPGTTVTGNITISLAVVFGLAKIAATGSPTVTIEIELKYTSGSGNDLAWRGGGAHYGGGIHLLGFGQRHPVRGYPGTLDLPLRRCRSGGLPASG